MIELYNYKILYNDAALVAYYRMEGNGNDSKNSNNGVSTDVTFGGDYGRFGLGGLFNETSSNIEVPSNSVLNLTTLSISVWFKRTDSNASTTNQWVMLSKAADNNVYAYENYFIRLNSGADDAGNGIISFGFRSDENDWKELATVTAITDTKWHNVIATRDNTSKNTILYIDGLPDSSGNLSGTALTGDYHLFIGKSTNAYLNSRYFKGSLDEIAIFNRVLSPTEIKNYYDYCSGNFFMFM